MQSNSHRVDRLAGQIRAEVATVIAEELEDPRVGFTTVLRVDVSADLQHARVHVSVLGDAAAQERTLEGLVSATAYIRHEVGHRLNLRRVPEFAFVLDHGPEEGIRLEKLFESLHKEEGET
ncbi:MAG: 30S ribosome-binding factor RbfA [Terriglobia bacterium]